MAEKSGKKKARTSAKAEPSVLGSLSTTRPTRLGRERPAARTTAATAKQAAATTPKAPRPRSRPTPPPPPPPEPERKRGGPPSGPELVTTAVKAAGEVAQFGLTAGARVLRRAASRLPRP